MWNFQSYSNFIENDLENITVTFASLLGFRWSFFIVYVLHICQENHKINLYRRISEKLIIHVTYNVGLCILTIIIRFTQTKTY